MAQLTRRNFLGVAAGAGIAGMVAGCSNQQPAEPAPAGEPEPEPAPAGDIFAAPDASAYPIEPDGDDVAALWTSETLRNGWTRVTQEGGAVLGVMDPARIIQVNGLAFRDMDGDGKLSLWEDWRQSADDRAAALASVMTADECIQLMWHGGVQSVPDAPGVPTDPNDIGLLDKGSCAGVSRLSSGADSYAAGISWINRIQEACEKRPYGIPYICSADPYSLMNLPSTVGLAPAMDKDIWRKAGMWISRAWRSVGVRCELGPQIDLYTDPTVARLNGAETEDPALDRDFIAAFGAGLQSTWGDNEASDDKGWGSESVAIMLKHFVGAGAIEGGRNDHGDAGKYDIFPGGNYGAHLVPFLDGGLKLDSKTGQMSAIMPNYGIAYSEDEEYGQLVGGGFNKKQIGILRNAGWDGMVCTDWGIIDSGRGTEGMTREQRYRMMIDASVDQYGGGFMPEEVGTPVYQGMVDEMGEDEALARVRESARRILKLMVNVELFDQPYCDTETAKAVFESADAAAFADECNDKCVIMLKNAGGTISANGLGDKPKVYVPQVFSPASSSFFGNVPSSIKSCFNADVAAGLFDVVSDTVGEPTGDPFEGETEKMFQETDITRATAEDLADVQFAVVKIKNPQDAFDGVANGGSFGVAPEGEAVDYLPISLQYRPYTADGEFVRKESFAGDILEDGSKENRSYFGKSTFATNESELDLVIDTKSKLPEGAKLILIVDADHPMCFHEVEPYADVILMAWAGDAGPSGSGFNIPDTSFARILAGETEPYGLLQFQMPKDMDEVEKQLEDTPRDMECYVDSEGNAYDFCFGLNWSGKIDDDRVKTYSAAPITTPETEVIPG